MGKFLVATFLVVAFVLSALSSLDCVYIKVDVGFSPQNIPKETTRSTFGIGIWTFEDSDNEGFCIDSIFQWNESSRLTEDDDIYTSFFVVGDFNFTCIRFLSVLGVACGIILSIYAWSSVLSIFRNKRKKLRKIVLIAFAFFCEGLKMSMMFLSGPCISEEFWEDGEDGDIHPADQCIIGRGCYMSIVALLIYFTVLLITIFCDNSKEEGGIEFVRHDDTDTVVAVVNRGGKPR